MPADKPTPDPIYPGNPQLPGRGRTDVNPSHEPGIDELPDNEGELPRDREESENLENVPDTDPDQAERDGVINRGKVAAWSYCIHGGVGSSSTGSFSAASLRA